MAISDLGSGKRNSGGKAQKAAVTAMAVTAKTARKFSRRGNMAVASQEGGEKRAINRPNDKPDDPKFILHIAERPFRGQAMHAR
jgi:hypothetical protein